MMSNVWTVESVIDAVNILYNAPNEALRDVVDSAKARSIIDKLQQSVDSFVSERQSRLYLSPSTDAISEHPHCSQRGPSKFGPSTPNSTRSTRNPSRRFTYQSSPTVNIGQVTIGQADEILSRANKVMKALNKAKRRIKETFSKPLSDITEDYLDLASGDPRLYHLQNQNFALRRALSQRSLALAYDVWRQKKYNSSKIDIWIHGRAETKNAIGSANEYLKSDDYPFAFNKDIRYGLEHGMRMLVFERLFDEKSAVSGILSFAYSKFRQIKCTELRKLKEVMIESPWFSTLAAEKTIWFEGCQATYDNWLGRIIARERQIDLNLPSAQDLQANQLQGLDPPPAQSETDVSTLSRVHQESARDVALPHVMQYPFSETTLSPLDMQRASAIPTAIYGHTDVDEAMYGSTDFDPSTQLDASLLYSNFVPSATYGTAELHPLYFDPSTLYSSADFDPSAIVT